MWRPSLVSGTRVAAASAATARLWSVSCRSLSYDAESRNASFYYANGVLSATSSFSSPSKFHICFTPNYRLIGMAREETSLAHTVKERIEKVDLSLCHPVVNDAAPTASSNLPFEVKPKEHSAKSSGTILQRYVRGDDVTFKQLCRPYINLTKPRLTFLIMLSSTCSYVLAPGSTDVLAFLHLTAGTILASGAANAINMAREPSFDKQMVRTATRPIVRGQISPKEAYYFAAVTGALGCAILYYGVNPTVAGLGLLNIGLYSWIYTSLKRKSILNTWVGALVGAIPPLMGWAACSSLADPGAWLLAAMLYAWQFPHFNSLSHNIKTEYQRAGYVMTAFVNPKLNARVALRYSLLMFPICIGMSYFGVCDKYFAFDSSILNGYLSYWSFKFWWQQHQNYSKATIAGGVPSQKALQKASVYARSTFWGSIWQLPVVLALMMLHKKGQWDRFFGPSDRLEA